MRAYLPLTSIVHTHRHRQRCLLIDWSLPHHWAGPMLTSSLDPQGFTKVKGQSVQIVPPVAVCSAWKTGLCSRYCFPINSTWLKKKIARLLDWMCCLHVPMGNSHLRDQSETGHSIRPVFFFFGLLWSNWESEPDWEGEFTPFSLLARQAQVPCELCGEGPESARCLWLCLVQRCRGCVACETCIHCSVEELNRARKALQAWETGRRTKKENESDSKGRRGRLSTDYGM